MMLRLSVGLSLVALLLLAGLQYHWIGQIAVAERQRLERRVAESSNELAEDFSSELRSLGNFLEPRFAPAAADPATIAARFRDWMANAVDPALVKNLYIVRSPEDVLRLNPVTGGFESEFVSQSFTALLEAFRDREALPDSLDSDQIVLSINRRFPGGRGGDPGTNPASREGAGPGERENGEIGWIAAELNRDVIVGQIFPRLVARRFPDYEGRDYRVAVTASPIGDEPETIFTSGKEWTNEDLDNPDYATDLLMPPPPPQRRGATLGGPPSGQRGGRGGERGRGPEARGPMVTLIGQSWRLLVKRREGSVETAVAEFRRRNMAVSFGILVVLGVSAVAIVISSSRARRLGRLQMEFAAGISHELRTPLAVIQSAAHNLGAGVVNDREGIAEYASIVKSEARRLTEMVEQVMAYTEIQSGRKHYDLAPVDPNVVTETAVRNMANVLREGNADVSIEIEPSLPPVLADAPALIRCLQNLLSNAVKYGRTGDGCHIEIQGRHIAESQSPGKVQLIVVDHGPGVPTDDISHLFEPFYRGSNASPNTPGNGLGLHLVDRIMNAQRGSVTFESGPDGGARFTLTLQASSNT